LAPVWSVPLLAAFGIATLTAVLWQALDAREHRVLERALASRAALVSGFVQKDLQARVNALHRLGARWRTRGGTPPGEWHSDAANYIDHQSGYRAIAWVDAGYQVRWIEPEVSKEAAQHLDRTVDETRQRTLEAARASSTPTITHPIELANGMPGLLIGVPLYIDERFDGFMLGVIDIRAWLDHVLARVPALSLPIAVYQDTLPLYERPARSSTPGAAVSASADVAAGETLWSIAVFADEDSPLARGSKLPWVVLGAGMIGAVLLGFALLQGNRARRGQEQLETVLDAAGEGVYGVGPDGRTTFANPASCEMLGYSAEEILGQPMHALIHHSYPDGSPYPPEKCQIYAALVDGEVHRVDKEVMWRKDGSSFPVDYISTPMCRNGVLAGAVVTFRDITERHRAERKFKLFRALIDQSREGIVFSDPETGHFLDFTEKFCRMTGYGPEEMGSLSVIDLDLTVDHAVYTQILTEARSKGSLTREGVGRRKDGSTFPLEVNVSYIRLDRDYIVAMVRDITERKEQQAALRESRTMIDSLLSAMPVAVNIKDREGRYVFVNANEAENAGCRAEAMIGMAAEIEWARDAGGFKMLQVRPLHMEKSVVPDEIWARHPGIKGHPAGIGWGSGKACVITCECELARVAPGDVLVTHVAGPTLSQILPMVSGVVAELGGSTSHLASLARERGIPMVLGVQDATSRIPDGSQVAVDGVAGIVRWMDG